MNMNSQDIKAEIAHQAQVAANIGKDAILSNSWLYPIKGIYYASSEPSTRAQIQSQLLPRLLLSVAVLALLFITIYVPQSLALSLLSGPLGFISSIPLVISESNVLIQLLSPFILTDHKDLIFDTVLLHHGLDELVSEGREVSRGAGNSAAKKLAGSMKAKLTSPLQKFSPSAMAKYLLTIPLNSIPAIGTVLFITLNGKSAGPRYLARYFQLKRYSESVKAREVEKRVGSLTGFGVATVVLGLVPVVGQVLELTNVVGAALMAVEMEKTEKKGM